MEAIHSNTIREQDMERELSSRGTFIAKYVVPGILIPLISVQVAIPLLRTGRLPIPGVGGAAPPIVLYDLFAFWLVACAFIFWFNMSLKRVRLTDGAILVSNYIKEWRVPFGLIESVSQSCWFKPRPITIRLRADVGFGTSVRYMPPRRWFLLCFWREDREVAELGELAGLTDVKSSND
jgi:hypothetical protein